MATEERRKQTKGEEGVFSLAGERLDDGRERNRASRAEVEPLFRDGLSKPSQETREPRA